jgi:hypothetical protein
VSPSARKKPRISAGLDSTDPLFFIFPCLSVKPSADCCWRRR